MIERLGMALAVASLSGCTVDLREGTVTCGPPGNECPPGWFCHRAENLCRRSLPRDAATDASPIDAPRDGGPDAGTSDAGTRDAACPAAMDGSENQWSRLVTSTGPGAIHDVAMDGASVIVVGSAGGPADFGCGVREPPGGMADAFVARYSSTGVLEWVRRYGATGVDVLRSVDVSGADVAVTGTYSGTVAFGETLDEEGVSAGMDDVVVLLLDGATGATRWMRSFGSAENDESHAVAIRGSEVCFTGLHRATITLDRPHTAMDAQVLVGCLSLADGRPLWSDAFGGSATSRGRAVAFGADGALFVAGTAQSVPGATALGANDAFLRQYTGAGAARRAGWALAVGGAEHDEGLALAVDASQAVLLGLWSGVWALGGAAGDAGATPDFFVLFAAPVSGSTRFVQAIPTLDPSVVRPGAAVLLEEGSAHVALNFQGTIDLGDRGRAVAPDDRGFLTELDTGTGQPLTNIVVDSTMTSALFGVARSAGVLYLGGDLAGATTFPRPLASEGAFRQAWVGAHAL